MLELLGDISDFWDCGNLSNKNQMFDSALGGGGGGKLVCGAGTCLSAIALHLS